MTPETATLVTDLRLAYRDALVVQAARDAAEVLHREKSKELSMAWDKVYRLQRLLMEGQDAPD
jgi:hypothetical protein